MRVCLLKFHRLIIIVNLLSYEGPRLQNLDHLYRKTHNKKTKTNQNITKNKKHSLTNKSLTINIKPQKF